MIALSGCAKRNADRELARVLALADLGLREGWTLAEFRRAVAALDHREIVPDLPAFEPPRAS